MHPITVTQLVALERFVEIARGAREHRVTRRRSPRR